MVINVWLDTDNKSNGALLKKFIVKNDQSNVASKELNDIMVINVNVDNKIKSNGALLKQPIAKKILAKMLQPILSNNGYQS